MEPSLALREAGDVLADTQRILVFTGAGVSTESGIPDFRGPDGLWTKMDPDDFNIDRYLSNPELRRRKWQMHVRDELWGARSAVEPNRSHHAIVELFKAGRLSGCVTQNIDGLHGEAGLPEHVVAELHGNTRTTVCLRCDARWPTTEVLLWVDAGDTDPSCPDCGGIIKTSEVSFGQLLPEEEMDKARVFADDAQAVLVIGSTVSVWPAAEVPITMARDGKPLVIVNMGPTEVDDLAVVKIEAKAGDVVPSLVEKMC